MFQDYRFSTFCAPDLRVRAELRIFSFLLGGRVCLFLSDLGAEIIAKEYLRFRSF
jgi:hypothetical protein